MKKIVINTPPGFILNLRTKNATEIIWIQITDLILLHGLHSLYFLLLYNNGSTKRSMRIVWAAPHLGTIMSVSFSYLLFQSLMFAKGTTTETYMSYKDRLKHNNQLK